MILNKVQNFYSLILNYKYFVLFILIILLIFNITNFNKFKLDASADTLILENDEDYKLFKEYSEIFYSKNFLILAYKSPYGKINEEYLNELQEIESKLKNIEDIDSIFSINNAPIILSEDISITDLNIDNIKYLESGNIELTKAIDELSKSPIFKDQLINSEKNISAIIIYTKDDIDYQKISKERELAKIANDKNKIKLINEKYEFHKDQYNKKRHKLIIDIRNSIKDNKNRENIYLGGIDMIADDSIEYVKKDIRNFGIGVFIFIIFVLSIFFKNIKWVMLPLITTFFSVTSIISILSFIGWKVTVISSNFISLMIILTISMNIHIIVRYHIIKQNNNETKKIISLTMKEMLLPCLYTSLTTIVAFFSLVFSDIRPVIDFGWIMIIGLTVTFLCSFILLPTLIVLFPATNINYKKNESIFINYFYFLIRKYPNSIIAINIIIISLSSYGISNLKVENSFINYFKKDTEIYKGMKLIDDNLGGTTPMDVVVKFKDIELIESDIFEDEFSLFSDDNSNEIDYWLTPDKLETIYTIHKYLENRNEIGKVQSIQSFIELAELINNGPLTTFELSLIYKNIPENMKDELLGPYISIDDDLIRINSRIKDSKDIIRNQLIKDINSDLNNKFNNVEYIKVNGLLVLYNNMLQSLFSSQIKSLVFVMIAIFLMFLILFKSFILSIAAIIPNIFAAAFILGLIGIFRIPLDMMTITIAAITIGIAVDNSIHYIYRVKKELNNNKSLMFAINECHNTVGNAIMTTSLTIAFGFSVLLLSNFYPTIYFGIFTSIAMIVAMLGVMISLPVLLILFRIREK
ncbi:MAG: hypothetical protein CFH22_00301 [Alphaproteobacteria bacterium MarineAlpha5_Bin12]|nr:hypothetical protein [Pelagibacteraceae bacterium]PPR41760.1 MAG: hypothetical protein CFH22_00301 [Alphaproteobacteria bacterium MarineAlpha5_Bin12]|tara:strand:- start:19787 stop:22213 length:2427 start_codon:yes stop_codon:yes gene_type:complete